MSDLQLLSKISALLKLLLVLLHNVFLSLSFFCYVLVSGMYLKATYPKPWSTHSSS
jgi:hypothetical protein